MTQPIFAHDVDVVVSSAHVFWSHNVICLLKSLFCSANTKFRFFPLGTVHKLELGTTKAWQNGTVTKKSIPKIIFLPRHSNNSTFTISQSLMLFLVTSGPILMRIFSWISGRFHDFRQFTEIGSYLSDNLINIINTKLTVVYIPLFLLLQFTYKTFSMNVWYLNLQPVLWHHGVRNHLKLLNMARRTCIGSL